MKINAKLDGFDTLNKWLDDLKKLPINVAIENVASKVREEARARVPVDKGDLLKSIQYRMDYGKTKAVATVFSNLEYAIYVEFGTGPKGQENHAGISPHIKPVYSVTGWTYYNERLQKFISTTGQPARPFLYPALADNRQRYEKYIKEFVKRSFKK